MAKETKITYNLAGLEKFKDDIKGYRTRVGVLGAKATRNDGEPLNNAEIMLIQITGSITNNIPPRDCLLMPIEHEQRDIIRQMNSSAQVKRAVSAGDMKGVFRKLGEICEGVIHRAFESSGFGQWAPNTPSTIRRKGSDRPLIDSSQMRRAVISDVVTKGQAQ